MVLGIFTAGFNSALFTFGFLHPVGSRAVAGFVSRARAGRERSVDLCRGTGGFLVSKVAQGTDEGYNQMEAT